MQRASNHDLFVFIATSPNNPRKTEALRLVRSRGYSQAQITAIFSMFARVVTAGDDDFPAIPGPAGIVVNQPEDIVVIPQPTPQPIPRPAPSPTPINPLPQPRPIPQPIEDEMPEDGEDLRFLDDWIADAQGNLIPSGRSPETNGDGVAEAGLPIIIGGAAALALLRRVMVSATTITRSHWDNLPGWARTALAAVGFGVGVDLALDIPGIPGDSLIRDVIGGGDDLGRGDHLPQHMVDGHLGAHIVGSWQANGVTFYRLSDGKLAVQNKKGRWKVWRPKRPIVLMPGGATNLKTLLKADKLLNTQAKKIAVMLNRRAPRSKKAATSQGKSTVIASDGKVISI